MRWKERKNIMGTILGGLLLSLILTGCVSFQETQAAPAAAKFPIYGQEMLSGLQSGSYRKFTKDFSGELLRSISEKAFDKLRDDLEKNKDSLKEWRFLTTLDRAGIYRVDLWKVTFLRSSSSGKRPIERLFMVTSTRLDGKDQIIGFKFDMLF